MDQRNAVQEPRHTPKEKQTERDEGEETETKTVAGVCLRGLIEGRGVQENRSRRVRMREIHERERSSSFAKVENGELDTGAS